MRLPTILKIFFGINYIIWVIILYQSMPPEGLLETAGVLAASAAIFIASYFFYLFLIRLVLRAVSKKLGRDPPGGG